MSTPIVEDRRTTAHYIVSEAHGYRSREQAMIAAGSGKLIAGTVLGRVTATRMFAPFDPAATDGSQNAAAILYEGCDATSADVRRTVSARDTEIQGAVLVWKAGVTDNQKTAALASLAALGLIAR